MTVGSKHWSAIGSLVGVIGVVTVSVANICMVTLDTSCKAKYGNWTGNGTGHNESNGTNQVLLQHDTCESALHITTAFLALCGATLLWSLSAGMVIYRLMTCTKIGTIRGTIIIGTIIRGTIIREG